MKYLFILLIFISPALHAFELEISAYNDFIGKIDEKYENYMSLYPSSDGTIQGHYFYKKYEKKIALVGKFSGRKMQLNELDKSGHVAAVFEGELVTKKDDLFYGTWKQINKDRSLKFEVSLLNVVWAKWNNRYADMGATSDEEVEAFAKKVKSSILESNYKWLSINTSYPISLNVDGIKRIIKSQRYFLAYAPQIFTTEFKKRLSESPTTDMFAKYVGAMIGDGEIWMSYVAKTDKGPFKLKITQINN